MPIVLTLYSDVSDAVRLGISSQQRSTTFQQILVGTANVLNVGSRRMDLDLSGKPAILIAFRLPIHGSVRKRVRNHFPQSSNLMLPSLCSGCPRVLSNPWKKKFRRDISVLDVPGAEEHYAEFET